MALVRKEFIVSGMVQGVGFRFFVRTSAYDHNITGKVENMGDGTVKIVAEGENEDIQKFLDAIKVAPPPIVVRRDPREVKSEEIGKRKDTGFTISRGLREYLFGPMMVKLDLGVYHLQSFKAATDVSFNKLDEKYGTFSKHLEQMDGYLMQIATTNQETSKRLAEISKTNQETAQNIKEIVNTNQKTSKHLEETSKHLEHISVLVGKIADERAHR